MKTIGAMLTRMILIRFAAILVGVSLFVLTLEVISYSKEILALSPGDSMIIWRYCLMRLPATLATFLPLSFLLGLLLTITELSYRNEITAIWAAGLSPMRLIFALVPLSITVGILHFVIADRAIPHAAPTLRQWGIADYDQKSLKIGERDPIWLRSGNDILRAGRANANSTLLQDVTIFRRDDTGILHSQIMAEKAVLSRDRWALSNVVIFNASNLAPQRVPAMTYEGQVRPAAAGSRSGDPEEMTIGDLSYFVENQGFGIRPTYVYTTWWHKRLTTLLTGVLMASICIPLAARFRRGGGLGVLFSAGVGLGFLYFILDGMLLSAGELGFVSPWLAAWFPTIAFAFVAAALILRGERA